MIFDKGVKATQWRKNSLFNKWCWENGAVMYERMKLQPYRVPNTKINSKWIQDLSIKPIKFLENVGNIGPGSDFFGYDTQALATKNKNRGIVSNLKPFVHQRTQQSEKATYGMEETIYNHVSDKVLIYRVPKELLKQKINPVFKWEKT